MDLTNVPDHCKAGTLAMSGDRALAQLKDAKPILDRYEDGESVEQIAKSYQVSPQAVYAWLHRNAEEQWKSHLAAKAHYQLDQAEDELRTASDNIAVSRSRELLRAQQWRLERVLRRVWGQDSPTVQVNINLGDVREQIRVLEADLGLNAAVLQPIQPDCDNEPSA